MQAEVPAVDGKGSGGPAVVVAHDFAETYGGAERLAAAAAALFPSAPFWVITGRRRVADRMGVPDRFHCVLPAREKLLRHYRMLAPLYPALVASHPLPPADVLLTSHYAFAHGFRTENHAPQVCYCHSPLRFAWSMTEDYAGRVAGGPLRRRMFRRLVEGMRRADRRASRGVARYVTGSRFVAAQLKAVYGREAQTIRPPVDCELFKPAENGSGGGHFLFCGRLVEPYKRPGIVIEAFRSSSHRLIVAGDGPAYRELKERAGPNVEFVGQVEDHVLVPLMQGCAATIFPSVDDFGLIPVETMACGRPVLAFAGGGALETVLPGKTGEFFHEPTAKALREALERFEPAAYDPLLIRAHAEQWRVERFEEAILRVVQDTALGNPPSRMIEATG